MNDVNLTRFNSLTTTWFFVTVFFVVTQLPALMPLNQLVHMSQALASHAITVISSYYVLQYSLYMLVVFWLIDSPWIVKVLNQKALMLCLIALLFLLSFSLYHIQLHLQTIGRGSDEDQALIISGWHMIHGVYPYIEKTRLNNGMSPGPGWIALLMPFTLTGLYAAMSPVFITSVAYLIYKIKHSCFRANVFLLVLFSSMPFWELIGIGSDLLAMASLLFLLAAGFYYLWGKVPWVDAILVVLLGAVMTARVNLLCISCLFGVLAYKRNLPRSYEIAAVPLLIALFIHLLCYPLGIHRYVPLNLLSYPPFQLFTIFGAQTSFITATLLPFLIVIAGAYILFSRRYVFSEWIFALWLVLEVPLFIVAVNKLYLHGLKTWGGTANIISFATPLLLAWVAMDERFWRSHSNQEISSRGK